MAGTKLSSLPEDHGRIVCSQL